MENKLEINDEISDQEKKKRLIRVSTRILKEHKRAFEVLGNG